MKDSCSRCEVIKQRLAGRSIEFRQIEEVQAGRDPLHVEGMAQLAWQDYELPVVLLDGEFVGPAALLNERCAGQGSTPSPDPSGPLTRSVLPSDAPDSCGASCPVVPKGRRSRSAASEPVSCTSRRSTQ